MMLALTDWKTASRLSEMHLKFYMLNSPRGHDRPRTPTAADSTSSPDVPSIFERPFALIDVRNP